MAKKIPAQPSRRDFVKWSGWSGGVILLGSGAILRAEQPSRRIITFDCYGTLIEMRPVGAFLAKLADQHGIDRKAFGSAFGREMDLRMQGPSFRVFREIVRAAFARCGEIFKLGALDRYVEPLLEEYRQLRPFPEVPEALQRLAMHFELCLMSNSERDVIAANVRALQTDFASVFTAEDVGCYKPDLRFFRIVADRLHFDEPLIKHVHVAAGFWYDVIPAASLGWKRIWVNRNHAKGDERYRPYGEAANLSSAAEVIEKTIG